MRWRGLAKATLQVRLTAIAYNFKRSATILALGTPGGEGWIKHATKMWSSPPLDQCQTIRPSPRTQSFACEPNFLRPRTDLIRPLLRRKFTGGREFHCFRSRITNALGGIRRRKSPILICLDSAPSRAGALTCRQIPDKSHWSAQRPGPRNRRRLPLLLQLGYLARAQSDFARIHAMSTADQTIKPRTTEFEKDPN
jgi:hypothetical protein